MKVAGEAFRTIWVDDGRVRVIDQTVLPHRFETCELANLDDAVAAIAGMVVRGAPLIGVAAAYGLALAMAEDSSDEHLRHAAERLVAARPTAVNLRWAVERMTAVLRAATPADRRAAAFDEAARMADEDVACCRAIGVHGAALITALCDGAPVNVLTHCNAGWLATVDWGTALAPVYEAHRGGVPVHVWVDETRPRNQGASLTAWELAQEGVPHTVIVDNAGGHLMQHGQVDLCIVGSDRTTRTGDVCNKIGTYLKALAARDNGIPFYAALPTSTIDWTLVDGVREIPIEERSPEEVTHVGGLAPDGTFARVQVTPTGSRAANFGFDVTPARLMTGIVTEHGLFEASEPGLAPLRTQARIVA